MSLVKSFKVLLVTGWFAVALFWMASSTLSKPAEADSTNPPEYSAQDYVGAETCKGCHEEQTAHFNRTKHAKLSQVSSWKDKVVGCESCHGPGKAHVEGGGDKTKIRTFENESAKQVSENCLSCHAGKEEHNNYRRGEHWRNDVGCIDCHSPHSGAPAGTAAGSLTLVSPASVDKPDISTLKMLKASQPQLCMNCHREVKSQFSMPFHHRVPEGTMKCSDCHNPHGGFELKQARLASGADASCLKCHKDKQGPFVYEHAPLKTEGCTACHSPHGSGNPKLLKRSTVTQLCLECHSNAHEIGAPGTPSFHNIATARFRNCTTCHMKIHGSQNHVFYFR
jgi:predicted CXXCH cytochrome family protein